MEERISKHQYSQNLGEEDIIFFNLDKRLDDGSGKDPLNIKVTSKMLMSKCENQGVFHIDGTYKLIKNLFSVMGN